MQARHLRPIHAALVLLLLVIAGMSLQVAHATSTVVIHDSSTCSSILGTWSAGNCNLPAENSFEVTAGTTVEVPSGVTLTITGNAPAQPIEGILTIDGGAALLIDQGGMLNVANSGTDSSSVGVDVLGTLTNNGVVEVANLGPFTLGIDDNGTLVNSGTMNIANGADFSEADIGIQIRSGATMTNNGVLTNTQVDDTLTEGIDNSGTVVNYGTATNSGVTTVVQHGDGVFNEECGATYTGTAVDGGTFKLFPCGLVFQSIQTSISSLQDSISLQSSNLAADYTNLQNSISGVSTSIGSLQTSADGISSSISALSTDISNDMTSLQTSISGLQTDVSDLSTSLSSDFNSLSSAIANVGKSGPLVGTSNDASVVTTSSFPAITSFSSSSSNWHLISSGSVNNQVVSGYVVSVSSGSLSNGILFVSLSNAPGSSTQTYAIPLGSIPNGVSPANGQLRFPLSVPVGSTVYVQVVSSSKGTVSVQLQLLNTPINP